jgi:NADH-quinone oxidoreductase subunit J
VELFFFFLFGGAALATAAYVIIAKNPINSAISLICTFLAVAGLYVLLNAHFLAIVQVVVYAGAIMVLFLFVIMLLNLAPEELGERRVNFLKLLGALLAAAILITLSRWFMSSEGPVPHGQTVIDNAAIPETWGGIRSVGEVLFAEYLLPFEMASILLLAAMVGAVLIARRGGVQ